MTLPAKAATDFRSNDPRDRYPTEANRVCRVCGDAATGMYFGALVCVPCKVTCPRNRTIQFNSIFQFIQFYLVTALIHSNTHTRKTKSEVNTKVRVTVTEEVSKKVSMTVTAEVSKEVR